MTNEILDSILPKEDLKNLGSNLNFALRPLVEAYDKSDWVNHAKAWRNTVDQLRMRYEEHFDTPNLSGSQKGSAKNLLIVQRNNESDEVWRIKQELIKSALSLDYNPYEYSKEPNEGAKDFADRVYNEFAGPAIVWIDKKDSNIAGAFLNKFSKKTIMAGFDNLGGLSIDNHLAGAVFVSGIKKDDPENHKFPQAFHGNEKVLQEYLSIYGNSEILGILSKVCSCEPNRENLVPPKDLENPSQKSQAKGR